MHASFVSLIVCMSACLLVLPRFLMQVLAHNMELVQNLGGAASDLMHQQPDAAGQGQGYAFAGAAAGSDGSGVVQHKQQQHQSAAGLKQRGVGQPAQQQEGLQMTQLHREEQAQAEGKDA
jgi:hypothetical protein